MKRNIIILLAALTTSIACNRNNLVIDGVVEGGDGSVVKLERLDVNRTFLIDSMEISKGGSFSIRTQIDEPELFILSNEKGEILNLLLFPGDRISVATHSESFASGYQVSGSEESENIRSLVEHLERTRFVMDSLISVADSIGDPENPQIDFIRTAYTQTIVKQKRFTIRYLVQHMTSLSSVYALYQKYDDVNLILSSDTDLQYFKTVADSLETAYPNSSLTKSLRADIQGREALYNEQQQMNTLLEMADGVSGMLDLTIPDRDGNEITLSSLKGNVVLVSFWASGIQASVRSQLHLKSTYDRYHSKGFEVYSISMDNDKINWMKSMDFNEFKWINVSELTYPESRAASLYNVSELPSNFLIDREGDIVAKNLFGRTLETWLDNLL